jgi:predicted amidohydrolase
VSRQLAIATVQFAENWNPRHNGRMVRHYIDRAAEAGAAVVHFHEGAMSGYCGAISRADYDWTALRDESQRVADHAAKRRVWVILGSAHRLTPPHRPHNCLYLIDPSGRIVDRYDKRFLMPSELDVYTPGERFVTFDIGPVRCGLLICFDLRFPELYRELYRRGVKVLFQSFYNGRMEGPGIHEHIMRQTLQAHAACNGMWISAPNSSAPYSRWPSVFIRPDGRIVGQLRRNRAGLMLNTADLDFEYYDPISPFIDKALDGTLHNGQGVKDDPRSKERQTF